MFAPANMGLLQKIADAASALLPGRAQKDGGSGPALAAASAVQSERIRLRVLRSQGLLDEIGRAALAATDSEVILAAMRELRLAAQTERDAVLKILMCLGESSTPCSLLSITALLNLDAFKEANQIFRTKVQSGDIKDVLAGQGERLFQVTDIASCLDKLFGTNDAPSLFMSLVKLLSPPEQAFAVAALFGDSEPGGYKYLHDQNSVPADVKLLGIQVLQPLPFGPARERALWYATRENDDVVAYNATVELINHWQTTGKKPPHLEPFAMLDVGLLFHLSAMAANFRWRTTVNLAELTASQQDLFEQLSELQEGTRGARLIEQEIEKLEAQIQREVELRLNSMQPIVNEITKSLNLPFAKLQASDDVSFAAYGLGTGTVYINRRTILDERPLGEDVMSSLLHELCHMGQDVLLIRTICDELNLKFGQHGDKLIPLWDKYSDIMGYAPDHIFLLAVLRLRGDRVLTADERQRATRLVGAANQGMQNHQQGKYIKSRRYHLLQSHDMLSTGELDGQLFATLRNISQLQGMFNAGRIPEVLVYELENCKAELEQVVKPFATDASLAKDPIALAELIFQSEYAEYVAPTAAKIRQVLLETLEEEIYALDRIESRVMRTGYHEDEAYTVSDRVEVIVKAILKGWYAAAA